MEFYGRTVADQAGTEFRQYVLGPAYLYSEFGSRRTSFVSLSHGNGVSFSPSQPLLLSMYSLAKRNGYKLLDSDDRIIQLQEVNSYIQPTQRIELTPFEWVSEGIYVQNLLERVYGTRIREGKYNEA